MRTTWTRTASIALLTTLAITACFNSPPESNGPQGGGKDGGVATTADGGMLADGATVSSTPFAPNSPQVYVAKVKNILTGMAPTDDEVNAVVADAGALDGLIDSWMATPAYQAKMIRFFELAFQQTQIAQTDFSELVPNGSGIGGTTQTNYLIENAEESLPRTALAAAAAGQPITSSFTTHQFMMTPALMELYAFMDSNQVTDTEGVTDLFQKGSLDAGVTMLADAAAIPFGETIDPASVNYMHWNVPGLDTYSLIPNCDAGVRVYPSQADTVHNLLYGEIANEADSAGDRCGGYSGKAAAATLFTASDFTTWSLITVRPPNAGEATTTFYDLPSLRTATELVLKTPRVGFFTTPAFEANWQTNTSNQMRVTTNQALIVATGAQVDGTDPTVPPSTPGLDSAHAAPGTACYFCHQTLDPTRSILQATYSYGYGLQNEASLVGDAGLFAFQGVIANVTTIDDFASTLASHPLVPTAWVQKLCYYANSEACAADDPEFQRIVALFQSSNLSWSVLVKALMESPITTNAMVTATATEEGEVASVSRRDHLCALFNARLGLTDVCGLNSMIKPVLPAVQQIATGLPSDAYGRGSTTPLLPITATLFFRAGTENMCDAIAPLIVDPAVSDAAPPATSATFTGADPTTAIAAFVSDLMGLTAGDERAAAATTVLTNHFQAAVASGQSATNSLRSTFVLACLAPTVVGMGM